MVKSRAALKRANTSHSIRVFPFKLLKYWKNHGRDGKSIKGRESGVLDIHSITSSVVTHHFLGNGARLPVCGSVAAGPGGCVCGR